MTVVTKSPTDEWSNKHDWRQFFEVWVDGKCVCDFYDGEPEDASISRDFNDVLKIPKLMQIAYEAGKNGEEFSVENIEVNEE